VSPGSAARVVALDGPSGSGKSTVARAVARALGWRYVDSGATYRAATLAVLRAGVATSDPDAVSAAVRPARIELGTDPDAPWVHLDGEDVSGPVRSPEVTAAVSAVSAVPAVRRQLLQVQRALMGEPGVVIEGRDIGLVVAPAAAVKVFLDADPQVRASRRAAERDTGVTASGGQLLSAVVADLARRDGLDRSRAASPLQAAPDAVHLDATALDVDQVVARVLELARAAGLAVR